MRRAPVLLLAALSPASAAIVADVSGCAAVDQYKSSTWEETGLNKFSLAIEVSNWLNNGRVELRWAQSVSVEKVFQATLLPQTEGSVATFLLPDGGVVGGGGAHSRPPVPQRRPRTRA